MEFGSSIASVSLADVEAMNKRHTSEGFWVVVPSKEASGFAKTYTSFVSLVVFEEEL